MQSRSLRKAVLLLVTLVFSTSAVYAEERAAKSYDVSADSNLNALHKKRQIVAEQIVQLSDSSAEQSATESEHSTESEDALTLLRSIDAVYAQHQSRLEQRQQLETEIKEADKELDELDKFPLNEPKPYSFLLLESLKDQLAAMESREEAINADLKSAERVLKAAHKELDADKKAQRTLVAPKRAGGRKQSELEEQAELTSTLARARIGLDQAEIEVFSLRLQLCKTMQKQLKKKIAIVSKDAPLSAQDRDEQLQRMAGLEANLKRRRADVVAHLQRVESRQSADLTELAKKKASQSSTDAVTEAWRIARNVYQSEIVIIDRQIENLARLRQIWKQRYDLANSSVDHKTVSGWLDEVDEFLGQLKDQLRSLEQRRAGGVDHDTAMSHGAESGSEDASQAIELRRARVEELRDLIQATSDDINSTSRTVGRFRDELKARLQQTADTWGAPFGDFFASILTYKVTGNDDQAITLGRLLILIAYIVGGILVAYGLSRLIGRRVLSQLGLHRGTAAALNSIVFYTMCMIFGVLSFQLLHIPLAAFAFLGGAAAIAVGFGSQDIMNNFMSGIILLTEQPIRVGDVIQLDDVRGLVLHIGLRSTRIETDANHELIVPNKTLLDEQVTNLTLSDNFVRMFITVTLDRDAPLQEAKRKMLSAAFLHPLVIKSPRPVVFLKEFDSYWLTFEVHFFLQFQNSINCAVVQSEILEVICDEFKPVPSEESASSSPTSPQSDNAELADIQKLSSATVTKAFKRVNGSLKLKA